MNAVTPAIAASPFTLPTHEMPRAIPILRDVPEGGFRFNVQGDDTDPHVRPGDIAVIDPCDRKPRAGDLFLIEWQGHAGPIRQIVEPYKSSFNLRAAPEDFLWFVRGCNNPRTWTEFEAWARQGRRISTSDGPYTDEGLEKKLVGRVIGIMTADAPIRALTRRKAPSCSSALTNGFEIHGDGFPPIASPGDFALIDESQRKPIECGLFAVVGEIDGTDDVKAMIVQTRRMPGGWAVCFFGEEPIGPAPENELSDFLAGRLIGVLTKIKQ